VMGAIVEDATEGFRLLGQTILDVIDAAAKASVGDFKGAFETLTRDLPVAAESAFSRIDIGKIISEEGKRDFLQEATSLFERAFGPELAERAAKRFRESLQQSVAGAEPGVIAPAPGVGLGSVFALTEQQKAVTSVIATMDVATRVALEYLDANTELQKAVAANVISEKERAAILKQLATNDFRRLAAETDDLASLTIDYNDALAELRARATAAGIGSNELNAAIDRQRDVFEKARFDLKRYQESLSATEALQEGVTRGFQRFTEGLGTIASNVADLTQSLLDQGLSAIEEFTRTGTLDFRQFALDVIAEIQKVILKMLALRVIQGLGGGKSPEGASTDTGAGGVLGIVGEILGGSRPGKGNTGGSSADPLFVQIINAGQVGSDTTSKITEAIGINGQDQAARDQQKTATEAGFFSTLLSGIGNAFTSTVDTIGGLFSTGFNGLSRGLGQLGSFIGSGLSSLASGLGGAISSLVGLFGGGGGGDTTSQILGLVGGIVGVAGGLQTGGSLGASDLGKTFLVGESGPELFTPKQTGTVIPNEALASMQQSAPPQVNVQVVNVDDPTTVPNAMSTREGEQVVLNIIQRNRGKLRQIIA